MAEHRSAKKVVGYGYVGFWSDMTLGWFLPKHLEGGKRWIGKPYIHEDWSNEGEPVQLCKITVEAIPMKRRVYVPFLDKGVTEQRKAVRLGLA